VNTGLQVQIVEFLEREAAQMHEKWLSLSSHKQGINGAVMQNAVGFTLVSSVLSSKVSGPAVSHASSLDAKLQETLILDLVHFLGSDECSQKHIDGLLFTLHGFLPKVSQMLVSTGNFGDNFRGSTAILITLVADKLDAREKAADSFNDAESKDDMDIDDDAFGFPADERNEHKTGGGLLREEVEASCSEETFRASTSALITLCSLSLKNSEQSDIYGQFVGYLMGATKSRLIMMRPVIQDFLSIAGDKLHDLDTTDICEHLARELLQGYDVERCETSVAICVDAMTATARQWMAPTQNAKSNTSSALMETCEEVYSHCIKIGLDKQVTSYTIRVSIANLLERILHVNPEYRKGHKQSPLELFINLLKDHDIRVMFCTAQKLHVLFKIFGERTHLKLTEDIEAALPSAKDWTEGLAMRVHALGLVALASLSNISRIVYRIFETGQLPDAAQYASRALLTVAKASGLESQRDLFKMFGAKLIFTWTEYYELDDFPSQVFGYDSLVELCEDVPEELIAQLLAKGKDDGAEFVASQLGKPLNELLVQAFARVAAYSLAWAVGYPPPAAEDGAPPRLPLAVRIRKRIGDDTYAELFSKNFPLIISILLELMQEDGTSERLLSRDPNLVDVYHIMKEITAEGYSGRKLAQPLEPHFRTKVILNAIHHACIVMELDDKNDLWTPAMVTFVGRRLFDTLHPALGPVHACGVIRNIRLLICLAGPKAYEGYQSEMLIHGLKPYVVDTACAEDAVGILRYLLKKAKGYLASNPSFVIGTFLSILTSRREFTEASLKVVQQDEKTSTTLFVVRSFHSWLAEYLCKFVFPTLTAKQNKALQSIVESAVGFRRSGNAVRDTKESELLRHLLDDDMRKEKLLDDMSRQLAFSLFCSNFMRPETFRDDMFGNDKASFERSRSLLRICKRSGVNDGFLLWSARVLGRAYASTGQLHKEWTQEMVFDYPTDVAPKGDMTPKVGILRRLKALLFSDDKSVVGLAETSLAQIIHDEAIRGEDTFAHVLTQNEYKALQWSQSPAARLPALQPIAPFGDVQTPVAVWIKDVATAMCTNMPDAPVIKGLSHVLQEVDGLAEELFPYITHILLARDSDDLREELSNLFQFCFQNHDEQMVLHNTILIKAILYLRSQPRQRETTERDRDLWLEIDYLEAAKAACVCKMFKTALLFTEIQNYEDSSVEIPSELLLEIFKNIDDPDSFYGVSQTFNLKTVMDNFEYEGNGWKSLSLRAANLESGIRLGEALEDESLGIIDSFNTLGMNGLSHSFLQNGTFTSSSSGRNLDNIYRSAWKLEQWDLPCPSSCNTRSAEIYRAFQSINNTVDSRPVPLHVDPHFLNVMKQLTAGTQTGHTLGGCMRTLAMLTEMEEVFISKDGNQLDEAWSRLQSRSKWMETGKYVVCIQLVLRNTENDVY
jgi:ataxia telangiectasia mutated family protein